MSPRSDYEFGAGAPILAEVFVFWLDGKQIMLTGPSGPEPLYVDVAEEDDPVETVSRFVEEDIGEPLVVHSTSWRASDDGVMLTFVALIDSKLVSSESKSVERTEVARSDATRAPERIETNQVVEHGLRHLAWLAAEDPVVGERLPDVWKEALADYEPQPFRNLR